MRALSIFLLSIIAVGCKPKPMSAAPASATAALPVVQKIVAAQLNRPLHDIRPDSTFASLGADDLDFVEIVMATEEELSTELDDAALSKAAGGVAPDKVVAHLTIGAFAAVAQAAPRQPPPAKSNESNDGSLRAAQTGTYGELSKLPNPRGHELMFVPELETLTLAAEKQAGRKLTVAEQARVKADAFVIAMVPADAAKLRQQRAQRGAR